MFDDFGIKYKGIKHVAYLFDILCNHYEILTDWGEPCFVAYTSYGTITLGTLTFPCPIKSKKLSLNSSFHGFSHATTSQCNQDIVGTLLYYCHAVDPTLACALNLINTKILNGTQAVVEACHQLLDYVVTHPNATMQYMASNIILHAHSDASCLFEQNDTSHVGGHYNLTSNDGPSPYNGAILTFSAIIKHVLTSAAEAELTILLHNCKNEVPS